MLKNGADAAVIWHCALTLDTIELTLFVKFAKWRAAITVGNGAPSDTCIRKNAEGLAEYAAACQRHQVATSLLMFNNLKM